ncbi:phage baseplate assembly protein V, partial [Apibacter raozihei]
QDPLKMGRVRVQFTWQKPENSQSPWVQVIQPHAGSGKGTYLNPEIGETVLVAFQGGNAEYPVVLGTTYNGGEIAAYYTEGNDLKVIQTRSGTKIVFNDAEGQGSILIEDPSGNRMFMDGEGNISMNAPRNFSINVGENMDISVAKNLSIDVGENINQTAGNDIYQTASGNIMETSDNRTEIVENTFRRNSSVSDEVSNEAQIFSNQENMTLQSGQTVMLNSSEKSNLF